MAFPGAGFQDLAAGVALGAGQLRRRRAHDEGGRPYKRKQTLFCSHVSTSLRRLIPCFGPTMMSFGGGASVKSDADMGHQGVENAKFRKLTSPPACNTLILPNEARSIKRQLQDVKRARRASSAGGYCEHGRLRQAERLGGWFSRRTNQRIHGESLLSNGRRKSRPPPPHAAGGTQSHAGHDLFPCAPRASGLHGSVVILPLTDDRCPATRHCSQANPDGAALPAVSPAHPRAIILILSPLPYPGRCC